MLYNRKNPSPRYEKLIEKHRILHFFGDKYGLETPEQIYRGAEILKHADSIKKIIQMTTSKTILDYGSGKGRLYLEKRIPIEGQNQLRTLGDYWGVDKVTCYDPCYPLFSELPQGTFDGVVCIDVLEHCPEEDIDWIVEELFLFAKRFVYVNVACVSAMKQFHDGENVHSTIKRPAWWKRLFAKTLEKFPKIVCILSATTKTGK